MDNLKEGEERRSVMQLGERPAFQAVLNRKVGSIPTRSTK